MKGHDIQLFVLAIKTRSFASILAKMIYVPLLNAKSVHLLSFVEQ